MSDEATIVTEEVKPDSPEEWAIRWSKEFEAAEKSLKDWRDDGGSGDQVVRRYLDKRKRSGGADRSVPLFTANTDTLEAMLYGKTPAVEVARRFADAGDDKARVGADVLERQLNADIEDDSDNFAVALRHACSDWLRPGLGILRWRYEVELGDETEEQPELRNALGEVTAEAVPPTRPKVSESVESDYFYWKDFLWSPCRVWGDARWVAFKCPMTRKTVEKRWGKAVADQLPYTTDKSKREDEDALRDDPWDRCEVWEVWCKETRERFWYVKGYRQILGRDEDPLQLRNFFPCPRPLIDHATTSGFIPRPSYVIHQDLYDELDEVTARIVALEKRIRVVGAYDDSNLELANLLKAEDGQLIASKNWAAFIEKGGLQNAFQILDLTPVVNALTALREYRGELVQLIYQVTGMSDIVRGQGDPNETATAQAIKGRFASVRIQAYQDEFARFATEAQAIKAEIIQRHFDPETIKRQSNIERTADAPIADAAIALLKEDVDGWRITVRPESVNLSDFAQLRSERADFMQGFTAWLQAAIPAGQAGFPMPAMLEVLRWMAAGFRGTSQLEGVIDKAIDQAEQAAQQRAMQPPPPDPKLMVAQVKAKADLQRIGMQSQADQQRIGMEMQQNAQEHGMEVQKHAMAMQSEEAKQGAEALRAVNQIGPQVPA